MTIFHRKPCPGFTLVELMIGLAATSVMMLGVAGIIAHNQRSFSQIRSQAFGEVVNDAYSARHAFESVVTRASLRNCIVGTKGTFLELQYYSDNMVTTPDRYAQFYLVQGILVLETGDLASDGTPKTDTGQKRAIARDVSRCTFVQDGMATRMHLLMDDGKYEKVMNACAMRRNP
ncbi:PilW family protein [Planctomycetota bacterium]